MPTKIAVCKSSSDRTCNDLMLKLKIYNHSVYHGYLLIYYYYCVYFFFHFNRQFYRIQYNTLYWLNILVQIALTLIFTVKSPVRQNRRFGIV